MSIKLISFDFDGVFVLDSEAVFKTEAWGIAFSPYEGRYEDHLTKAKTMFGYGKKGGRKETIEYVLEQLGLSGEDLSKETEKISEAFDAHVQARILEVGLVSGAKEMLEELRAMGVVMYLNSGTATAALNQSAQNLKIDHYFKAALGSTADPVGGSKVDNLNYMTKEEGVSPKEILFVGDGNSDRSASEEFECHFLGIANPHNNWANEDVPFDYVTNLVEVVNKVNEF